ncbi:hypothetical protein, partial [Kitasatospora cineracea]|uniref:hypothetical protein n=1 Tax=Kitasatospora cineracea TaxID=88074 RepID=UPI0033BFFED8
AEVEVDLHLETKGPEHCAAVIGELREDGYDRGPPGPAVQEHNTDQDGAIALADGSGGPR